MQVNSTVSFTGKKPPKKPKTQNRGLVLAGYASTLAAAPTGALTGIVHKNASKASILNPEDTVMIKKGIHEGLKDSGLYDKGVRVLRMQETAPGEYIKRITSSFQELEQSGAVDVENIRNAINNVLRYDKKDRKTIATLNEMIDGGLSKIQKAGSSALKNISTLEQECITSNRKVLSGFLSKVTGLKYKLGRGVDYVPGTNKIFAPDKSLQTKIFHEMGHAMNANSGFLMNAIRKVRPIAMFAPGLILGAALLNKRKTTDEQLPIDSKFQRLKDGIKRNAGKLTALAVAPMLLDEGLASLRGGKIAKNLFKDGKLSKEVLNKIRITNASEFAGYALFAIGAIAGAKLAIKIKDKMQAKYEAKQEAKYQAKLEKYNQKMAAAEAKKAKKA